MVDHRHARVLYLSFDKFANGLFKLFLDKGRFYERSKIPQVHAPVAKFCENSLITKRDKTSDITRLVLFFRQGPDQTHQFIKVKKYLLAARLEPFHDLASDHLPNFFFFFVADNKRFVFDLIFKLRPPLFRGQMFVAFIGKILNGIFHRIMQEQCQKGDEVFPSPPVDIQRRRAEQMGQVIGHSFAPVSRVMIPGDLVNDLKGFPVQTGDFGACSYKIIHPEETLIGKFPDFFLQETVRGAFFQPQGNRPGQFISPRGGRQSQGDIRALHFVRQF